MSHLFVCHSALYKQQQEPGRTKVPILMLLNVFASKWLVDLLMIVITDFDGEKFGYVWLNTKYWVNKVSWTVFKEDFPALNLKPKHAAELISACVLDGVLELWGQRPCQPLLSLCGLSPLLLLGSSYAPWPTGVWDYQRVILTSVRKCPEVRGAGGHGRWRWGCLDVQADSWQVDSGIVLGTLVLVQC